jgi:hypothetical protein
MERPSQNDRAERAHPRLLPCHFERSEKSRPRALKHHLSFNTEAREKGGTSRCGTRFRATLEMTIRDHLLIVQLFGF